MAAYPPEIACATAPDSELDGDLLVAPAFIGEINSEPMASFDRATAGAIGRAWRSGEFTGAFGELFVTAVVDRGWRARQVGLIGAGRAENVTPTDARRLGAAVARAARRRRCERVGVRARRFGADAAMLQALAEGFTLAQFDPGAHKTQSRSAPVGSFVIAIDDHPDAFGGCVARGRIVGYYCNVARELVNEPGNVLTPAALAERAARLGRDAGIAVEILDERAIAALGMNLMLGVSRGSVEPPRVIVLRHDCAVAGDGPVLGLVGKGVTFDGGGLRAKDGDDRELMKYDMAGGAAVICAMCALGALGARVRCVGVVPAVENMPGGGALRPGDVLRSAAGSTVEVVDPDAEGRLVLADGLWYARQLGATHLIDVATLTSACVAALGETASGLFGSPEGWIRSVRHAAERAGEPVWPLPLVDEEPSRLESTIADLANNAAGPGAATLAALFLREFAGGLPWAHVDIAGTAWSDYDRPFQPPGPTGVGVRTLMELALRSAESLPTRGDDEAEYTAANVTAAGGLERP